MIDVLIQTVAKYKTVKVFITKKTPKGVASALSLPLFISHFDVYSAILRVIFWVIANDTCLVWAVISNAEFVLVSVLVPGRWWPAGDPAARTLTSLWTLGAKLAKFTVHQITRYAAWAAVIIHTAIYSALSITKIKSRASLKPLTVMF